MEDRSRRNNVGLDGFPQVNENTWYKFEEQVQEVFSKKVRSENSKIERADRTKRNKNNKGSNTRTICRLQNHKEKEFVPRNRKKLKGSNIFINEDFCFEATKQ